MPESLTVISGKDDIALRSTTDGDWYVSLVVSLDGLPFFKNKDDGSSGGKGDNKGDGEDGGKKGK